jgi:type I restriction-modification system DNA methylase subunit
MPLFQNSVLNKHLKSQHPEELKEKWVLFKTYFHNSTIQENIRNSKEEQFQEGFLRELFVKVLGYTLNPEPNFNLTTEYKNVKDSKKADGAIIINNHVKAVIELKGTDTTDLSKVENQAFNYKNNQPECVYVITSNFEKIRFYIDNAIEHLEFNLFNLTEDEFQLVYVCLAHKNIESNVPKQIKDESVSQEDVITKKLYNDYSLFKRELYQNLVKLNPSYDPLELFKKSQKLLDRFLFIFFAEDRSLLPTNLIFRINKEWQQLREMRIEVSLYDRYKIYFNDLNHGAKVSLPAFSQTASAKKEEYQIYAYNGGLFQEDNILNSVKIDDDVLYKHTENLSNYDFASEVDVNILGHIFENSLNELDEIKAQLEGQEVEKTKTKRKKDGVFYTPKYITKYIVDNTVGKLCADKKAELQLNEEDYTTDKKRQQKTKQTLSEKLNTYRNWLLQLTICDPACGSGAFLNQALDFLIAEHRYIDELQAKLFGDALVLSDVEGSILENNLFGVDINEESVEIAKLSLWLRTAQPNRKLNELNNNIKCGNSLIDDVAVAGEKSFNWEQEFPQVFQNAVRDKKYVSVNERLARKSPFATRDELGDFKDDSWGLYNEFHEPKGNYSTPEKKHGFDVVIGNPPYVNVELMPIREKEYYKTKYKTFYKRGDMFSLFIDLSSDKLSSTGYISFIVPSIVLNNLSYKLIRERLLNNNWLKQVCYTGNKVFQDANVDTVVLVINKNNKSNEIELVNALDFSKRIFNIVSNKFFEKYDNNISIGKEESNSLTDKIYAAINIEAEQCFNIFQGVVTGNNDVFVFENKNDAIDKGIENELLYPMCHGRDITKWHVENKHVMLYINSEVNIDLYPGAYKWLLSFKETLSSSKSSNEKSSDWYFLHRPRVKNELLTKPKILIQNTRNERLQPRIVATIDEEGLFGTQGLNFIIPTSNIDIYSLLGLLNSKLVNYLFSTKLLNLAIKADYLKKLKFPQSLKESEIGNLAKNMGIYNSELLILSQKFLRSIERKFEIKEISKKMENWYLISYSDFIKELAKKKIKLSLSEEAEWEEYFTKEAKKALELKNKIDATDKEIDQMVYKLYDLTDEEIVIVENS